MLLCLGVSLVIVTFQVHLMSWLDPGSERLEEEEKLEKEGKPLTKEELERLHRKRKRLLFPGENKKGA